MIRWDSGQKLGAVLYIMVVSAMLRESASGLEVYQRGSQTPPSEKLSTVEATAIVGQQAAELVLALRDQDLRTVRQRVHPIRGLRFSPYAWISNTDIRFYRDDFPVEFISAIYEWGTYDGRGAPIRLSFADYWRRFIYDRDYADAPMVGYNHTIGTGNASDNTASFYPGSICVEYHFPNTHGMFDWRSLRLVFQEHDGEWFLVGIIHAQWTI